MGPRARLIIVAAVALVAIIAMWTVLVSPERSAATKLVGEISAEQANVTAAQQQVAQGEQARAVYAGEVRSLAVLSQSVPSSDDTPQLIGLINSLEVNHKVNYSTTAFASGAAAGGFESLALSFGFAANFLDLQQFLGAFDALTLTNGTGVLVNGRLVTINSVSLSPEGKGLAATVSMTAYQAAPATSTTVAAATP
jgi:Tfp pilus assembly protein PilO